MGKASDVPEQEKLSMENPGATVSPERWAPSIDERRNELARSWTGAPAPGSPEPQELEFKPVNPDVSQAGVEVGPDGRVDLWKQYHNDEQAYLKEAPGLMRDGYNLPHNATSEALYREMGKRGMEMYQYSDNTERKAMREALGLSDGQPFPKKADEVAKLIMDADRREFNAPNATARELELKRAQQAWQRRYMEIDTD
jgi:hypothetical protein